MLYSWMRRQIMMAGNPVFYSSMNEAAKQASRMAAPLSAAMTECINKSN